MEKGSTSINDGRHPPQVCQRLRVHHLNVNKNLRRHIFHVQKGTDLFTRHVYFPVQSQFLVTRGQWKQTNNKRYQFFIVNRFFPS